MSTASSADRLPPLFTFDFDRTVDDYAEMAVAASRYVGGHRRGLWGLLIGIAGGLIVIYFFRTSLLFESEALWVFWRANAGAMFFGFVALALAYVVFLRTWVYRQAVRRLARRAQRFLDA